MIIETERTAKYYLNVIEKIRGEKRWVMHFYINKKEDIKYGSVNIYDKRIVDYLRYFEEIKDPTQDIDVTWLILTYEKIDIRGE